MNAEPLNQTGQPQRCGICEETRMPAAHDPALKFICAECEDAWIGAKNLVRQIEREMGEVGDE